MQFFDVVVFQNENCILYINSFIKVQQNYLLFLYPDSINEALTCISFL